MSSYIGIEIGPQPPKDFNFSRCSLRSKNGQISKYTFLLLEGAKKYASLECISILTICSPDRHDSVDFLTREEIQEVSMRSRVKLLFFQTAMASWVLVFFNILYCPSKKRHLPSCEQHVVIQWFSQMGKNR